jgi:hypothetical protein
MRACPAAGHVIRIWMPRTGAPHVSRTPVIHIECVDSACHGQRSSPVELFHQIQRLNAAAHTSISINACTRDVGAAHKHGRPNERGRCAMCVLVREEKARPKRWP